jgi:hypothetical protein
VGSCLLSTFYPLLFLSCCFISLLLTISACPLFLALPPSLSLPLIPFFVLYFFALIYFFASTWGSFGSGTLSEWVQTFFSFSLAAFFPCFRRFRHALSFLPAVFSLSPLTHSSLFTFAIAALFPRLLAIAAKPGRT